MKRYIFILLTSIFFSNNSYSQLIIDQTLSDNELAQSLVGGGVEISNVQVICNSDAYGRFEEGTSNLGLPEGLLLTTGFVTDVAQASSGIMSTDLFEPGDPILTNIAGFQTYDACIFQFDVRPLGDTLRFRYRFGSEEYPDYVCSDYNDVFAFLITGPNPGGGNYAQQNIALIPGTNLPVSINSVNSGTPGMFGTPFFGCSGADESLDYANFYVDNESAASPTSQSIVFNGLTTVLTAEIPVVACELYTLRLGIADAGDGILDSGVFIEELTSPEVTLDIETEAGVPFAVPGCNDGILTFNTNFTPQSPLQVNYTITGSAIPNINYVPFQDSVIIQPGDTTASVTIQILEDSLGLGGDSIVISLISPCTNEPYDSVVLIIANEIELELAYTDTTICQGEFVQLEASGVVLYNWTPEATLDDPNIANPIAVPTDTTIYQVIGRVGLCPPDTAHVTVNTIPSPLVSAGPDLTMCVNDTIEINQAFSDASNVFWTPSNTLTDPNIVNTSAFPDVTTEYVLTGENGACSNTDTLTITVDIELNLSIINDTTICEFQSVQLVTSGASTYSWTPSATLDDPNVASPVASPTETTTYTVTGSSANCPDATASVTVTVVPFPDVTFPSDETICPGDSVTLSVVGGTNFSWSPGGSLDNDNQSEVIAFPTQSTTYTIEVGTADCIVTDTVNVIVNDLPNVDAGQDIQACTNEEVTLNASGANVYSWSPAELLSDPDAQSPTTAITTTTVFTVTGTNTITGCSNTDSVTVFIQGPIANAGEDLSFCTGESATLTGSADQPVTYAWSPVEGLSDATIPNPIMSLENSGETDLVQGLVLTVTDSIGCQDFDTLSVIVYPAANTTIFVTSPVPDAQGNYLIFEGETATMEALGGSDCVWNPQSGLSDPFSCNVTAAPDSTTTYTVSNVSPDGCAGFAQVTIMVEYERGFIVPTAFTPDGDGINDVLYPIVIGAYELEDFRIFNRWGELMFETNTPSRGWDGTYKEIKQPLAVYVWYAVVRDVTGDRLTFSGNVTLLR